jgi:hypothetical protein
VLNNTNPALEKFIFMPYSIAEKVIDQVVKFAETGVFVKISNFFGRFGHMGLVLGALASMLFLLVSAIRFDSLKMALLIILIPIALALAQYSVVKFIDLCEQIVVNTPTRMSGLTIFYLLGFFLLISGLCGALVLLYFTVKSPESNILFPGTLSVILICTTGILFLTPSALSLHEDKSSSAGQDGLSLLGTFLKVYLAGARFIFGFCCTLGGLAAGLGALGFVVSESSPSPVNWFMSGIFLVISGALIPITIYIISIIYFIFIDTLLSVISMAKKS